MPPLGVDLPVDLPIWALAVETQNGHAWPLDASTRGDKSVSWSANRSSNSRNLKLPFLTMRCLYWSLDLPVYLQTWALTVEMWNHHSWPLDASTGGIDLPIDLPIWLLTVDISNCHLWPIDASTGGRSASWFANMSSSSRNPKLPCLTTRCLYQRA